MKIPRLQTQDADLNRVQAHLAGAVESAFARVTDSLSSAAMPTGSVVPFAGQKAPSGFLLCDGSAVDRKLYADLFSVVGTTYGAGNGTNTFNLPDLRSRLPVGAGQGSGLTSRALAATGGEESHLLSAAESGLPAHTHAWSTGSGINYAGTQTTTSAASAVSAGANQTLFTGTNAQNAAAAAAQAHNTMPPFLALNFIIKT